MKFKTDEEAVVELMKIKAENSTPKEEYVVSGEKLVDKYIEPPFSVIDAKTGRWKARKQKWLDIGIKSEVGRDVKVLIGKSNNDYMPSMKSETSIFDPALCELMYTWFSEEGDKILDCFAGGSVRGVVASKLGRRYTGIELRQEQVDANIEQGKELCGDNQPTWLCGDSDAVLDTIPSDFSHEFDMIFSCPPYFDLEVYSNDKNDLSSMTYEQFVLKYTSIIEKSAERLKNGGYAVFVVGDVRDERGFYRDFVNDTKRAFMDGKLGRENPHFKNSGLKLYNDMVFLTPIGTAMIRAHNTFGDKKVVKIHENILVFKKL